MSILESIITKYGGTFLASLVIDTSTLIGEYVYDQDEDIYATILARMLKKPEIEECALINEMIACVEVIPEWDLSRYDRLLSEKEFALEIESAEEDTVKETNEKIYSKSSYRVIGGK